MSEGRVRGRSQFARFSLRVEHPFSRQPTKSPGVEGNDEALTDIQHQQRMPHFRTRLLESPDLQLGLRKRLLHRQFRSTDDPVPVLGVPRCDGPDLLEETVDVWLRRRRRGRKRELESQVDLEFANHRDVGHNVHLVDSGFLGTSDERERNEGI